MPFAEPSVRNVYNRAYYRRAIAGVPEKRDGRLSVQRAKRIARGPGERFRDGSNRRARQFGLPGRLRAADLALLPIGPCSYCHGEAESWDHVTPLSRGGPNEVRNLVPCCHQCNRVKRTRTAEEWVRE